MKLKFSGLIRKIEPRGMQSTVMIAFSLVSFFIMLVLGAVLYLRFSTLSREEMIQSTQTLTEQAGENLEDYLVSMRRISDAVYYNVIKESDFAEQDSSVQKGMNLLYEANRDNLRTIAIYNHYGSLMAAEPVALQKEDPNVSRQDWFLRAMEKMENMHFSTPHIQNLFDDAAFRYHWVISLSRVIELTEHGTPQMGVLLVDMDYSGIARVMKQMNTQDNGAYYYLCDSNGEIIYHPRQIQISRGLCKENSVIASRHTEGIYEDYFNGEKRTLVVNYISYTGWRLIGVIPDTVFVHGMINARYFIGIIMLLMTMMLFVLNQVVSVRIARPILRLNDSVMEYEAGEKPEIYIGGSQEIRHLGYSVQKSYEQIDTLMKKIVQEQTERRRSELDALQSQINPHFLYNTLDSIMWMIEGERNEEAAFMISQLAKLFRISLSKGRTVISVGEELQHAESYMNIQKIRYKDAFAVTFDADPEILPFCTVKLVLQPLLENAVSYGVRGMEDCGEIRVTGRREGDLIVLSVEDNGMGMTQEEARLVLTDDKRVHRRGSGVGLVNVNNRIRLVFGEAYGLKITSEPDEGTCVSVCIPAVADTEENRRKLEQGSRYHGEE